MADILGFITHHGTQNWWALCTRQPLGRPGERGLEPWGTLHSLLGEHEALREPTPRPLLGPPRAVVPISEPLFWPSLETGNLGRIKGWVVPPDPLTSLTWSPFPRLITSINQRTWSPGGPQSRRPAEPCEARGWETKRPWEPVAGICPKGEILHGEGG